MAEGKNDEETIKDSVNSNAAVLWQAPPLSPYYNLKCNTNLNLPPTNWLKWHESFGMQEAPTMGFSSFRMSHQFPDEIGEVDVVSSAENIKRLLKMSYTYHTQTPISLMVHRVGNTILIDDFDITKYLREQCQDWKWLKTFISETILNSLSEKDRKLMQSPNPTAIQDGTLLQKFIGHSVVTSAQESTRSEATASPNELSNLRPKMDPTPLLRNGPILPEAKLEGRVSDPTSSHTFNRNVLWTFEDIRMLIGTDLPIFGGVHRPCISLRLRDMEEPINVLTGIDYWLDNLMCNVPEVVMCYHLNGIVQKYDIFRTEDLPYLENSKFSPKVIRNVAQNILAFLKQNATKAGHTYWLFKGPRDDVVKLYDLTTLCKDKDSREMGTPTKSDSTGAAGEPHQDNNPFTNPVGMLLYSVARRMKMSTNEPLTPKQAGTIKALLDNCIKLLPIEKYAKIVTSSHYMLADLYIPTGIDPSAPNFPTEDDVDSVYDEFDDIIDDGEEEEEDLFDLEELSRNNVAIQNIQDTATIDQTSAEKNWKHNSRPPSLCWPLDKRCAESLAVIAHGLKGLKYFQTRSEEETIKEHKDQILKEEQNLNMARSHQPIPLPYEPLKETAGEVVNVPPKPTGRSGKGRVVKKENLQIQASTNMFLRETSQVVKSWDVHLKLLLLEKASLTYAVLAESCYSTGEYGLSLRYILMALSCQKATKNQLSSLKFQKCCLLGRAGDCYFQIIQKFKEINEIRKSFSATTDADKDILREIQDDVTLDADPIVQPPENMESLLLISMKCYEMAIELSKDGGLDELLTRLGNVQNELGVKYMYQAQDLLNSSAETGQLDAVVENVKNSLEYLQRGVSTFERLKDAANLCLVLSNLGRLNRLHAHMAYVTFENSSNLQALSLCSFYYAAAMGFYKRALEALGSRKRNPMLYDAICWEQSTATYIIAQLLFNTNPQSREEREKIISALQTALKHCDLDVNGPRYGDFLKRTADIHLMLGSSHHFLLLTGDIESDKKRQSLMYLATFHFDKCLSLYEASDDCYQEILRAALSKMHFILAITDGVESTASLLFKCLKNVTELVNFMTQSLAKWATVHQSDPNSDPKVLEDLVELEEKLKSYFMLILKTYQGATKQKSTKFKLYKGIYFHLLRPPKEDLSVAELCGTLSENLKKIHSDLMQLDLLN